MKPTFHAIPINSPFEDPCIYINIMREGRALLFDLGYLGRLALGNLLKVSDIFVTHTHMDHFMGFDMVLRCMLRRNEPLNIYGPENIIECVEGKLKGYTWNLIEDYPLKINVYAITDKSFRRTSFYAENSFNRIDYPESRFSGIILEEPLFKVRALVLSHQIPVIAYCIEEEFHINVNKVALLEKGLPVGPWLSDLKRAIRLKESEEKIFIINDKTVSLKELMDIVTITKGQKISYVMDVSPNEENVDRIIRFVKDSDILFCEAYFLDRDRERAMERHHLTAAIAGKIAREANAGNLEIMHFSPKYRHGEQEIYEEAMKAFKG